MKKAGTMLTCAWAGFSVAVAVHGFESRTFNTAVAVFYTLIALWAIAGSVARPE